MARDCKCDLVWITNYRNKILCGESRKNLGDVLCELASDKEKKIQEGQLRGDHVHALISIRSKYPVSKIVGYVKGKRAIHVARQSMEKRKNLTGLHF